MLLEGIRAFSFVHDSYGTYAPYVDAMDRILKQQFIQIHKSNPLEKFKAYLEKKYEIKLPQIPQRNDDFDINEVAKSIYFFS
jgi:DNA-directed RNA polymerase